MTSLYDAIMKAADHIEQNPDRFDFDSCEVPRRNSCGTPACALGWIAVFYGRRKCRAHDGYLGPSSIAAVMGLRAPTDFYCRMSSLNEDGMEWMESPFACARDLRLYAEKYHGHEKAPDWNALASGTDLLGESSLREQYA